MMHAENPRHERWRAVSTVCIDGHGVACTTDPRLLRAFVLGVLDGPH